MYGIVFLLTSFILGVCTEHYLAGTFDPSTNSSICANDTTANETMSMLSVAPKASFSAFPTDSSHPIDENCTTEQFGCPPKTAENHAVIVKEHSWIVYEMVKVCCKGRWQYCCSIKYFDPTSRRTTEYFGSCLDENESAAVDRALTENREAGYELSGRRHDLTVHAF